MFNLLGDSPMPLWVINSFPIIRIILMCLMAVCAAALIVVVLCQESNENGTNALTGINESYYSQNKGRSKEGMLRKATIALSIAIVACVIIYFILTAIYSGNVA